MKRERTKPPYKTLYGEVDKHNYKVICPYCKELLKLNAYAIAHCNITLETICNNCRKRFIIRGGW
jgi:uncharacterized CHY-type Zn-finger protein